jgi:uncharacterized membrane protein
VAEADIGARDEVDLSGLVGWIRQRDAVRWLLGGMVVVWALTFVSLGWLRHSRFATYGFDLGIYDQATWLLSRFQSFITVRGLPVFGNHANFILVAFVPFYRLGAGPGFLLVVQVLAQASGAVALYLLARDRWGDRWLALLPAAALLLNPTYQFLTWEFFHPEALAAAALLFACWAAQAKRWGWSALAAVLAMACKEEIALAVAGLGVLVWLRGERWVGLVTVGASLGWYLVATRLLIPWALGGDAPFYEGWFPELGRNAGEVLGSLVTRPGVAFSLATEGDRLAYYTRMLVPVALLALAEPRTLVLLAGPALAVNALTVAEFARDYRYHYSALVVAGLMVAAVEAIAILGRTASARRFLAGTLAAVALATTVVWGPSPISSEFRSGIWPLGASPRTAVQRHATQVPPASAVLSASYNLVPHLTHRPRAYQFPEPWYAVAWGIGGKELPDPAAVEWLVVDRNVLPTERERRLLADLLGRDFETRFEREGVVVAERVRPSGGEGR